MAKKRGPDGHRVLPPEVLAAVLSGDTKKCSELGKRGAAAKKRKKAAEEKKRQRELALTEGLLPTEEEGIFGGMTPEELAEEFRLRAEEANEHICPID